MAPKMKNNLEYHYESTYFMYKGTIVCLRRVVEHHRRYIYIITYIITYHPPHLLNMVVIT